MWHSEVLFKGRAHIQCSSHNKNTTKTECPHFLCQLKCFQAHCEEVNRMSKLSLEFIRGAGVSAPLALSQEERGVMTLQNEASVFLAISHIGKMFLAKY